MMINHTAINQTAMIKPLAGDLLKVVANTFGKKELATGYTLEGVYTYSNADNTEAYYKFRFEHTDSAKHSKVIKHFRLVADDETNPDKKWRITESNQTFELSKPSQLASGDALYNLPKIDQDTKSVIWIVEGEKKVKYLESRDILATTTGNATGVKQFNWQPLANRDVILWRDNDDSGLKWQSELIAILQTINCNIRLVDIAALNLPVKGDCIDWLKQFKADKKRMANSDDIQALSLLNVVKSDVIQAPTSDLKQGANTISLASNADAHVWLTPKPLVDIDTTAEPYPIDALPALLLNAVKEVQGFVQAPIAMVATSALASLALAGQGLINIKRAEKLSGPCSLFTLMIAESGERKSTLDGYFSQSIHDYQTRMTTEAKPDIDAFNAGLQIWNAKKAGKLDAIKQASKANKDTSVLSDALHSLEQSKPLEPKVARLIYGDTTPEQLAFSLGTKWPTGAVVSSEAGTVFGGHAMSGDSVTRNLAILNVLWDGGTHTVDRRTTESFMVRNARLSMSLGIQPATLFKFLDKQGDLARGSGFLARFLIAWPTSTQGTRTFAEAPSAWPSLAHYSKRITELLETPLQFDETGDGLEPAILELSKEAKANWVSFYNVIELELKPDGELSTVRDVASKIADNAARIAGLFHLLQHGTTGQVNESDMQAACTVAMWHLSESRRFVAVVAQPVELSLAIKLDDWLIRRAMQQQASTFSTTSLLKYAPNQLRKKTNLYEALATLIEADRIYQFEDGNISMIAINPQLLGGAKWA